nr:aminopeptidase [Blautia sp. An249]
MEKLNLERYELAKDRIHEITMEEQVPEPYRDFFSGTADFLQMTIQILEEKRKLEPGQSYGEGETLDTLSRQNQKLYEDIQPENYKTSYGNPAYAAEVLDPYGKELSFLYAELRGTIAYAFEKKIWDMTVCLELFLEVYFAFTAEELPTPREIRDILYWYVNDYCQPMVEDRIRVSLDPQADFAAKIIMEQDLEDLRYLYLYGEYVSSNELGVAKFLNSLSQEEIDSMAATYTEGYRQGFLATRKDLSKKKTVNIRYTLGFERMVRSAILQFEKMGLKPTIYRAATHIVNKRQQHKIGYLGGSANLQYEYDHRGDEALFLDGDFVKRKLRSMQMAYEKYQALADVHGGPACIETFGEKPFSPAACEEALSLSPHQQKLRVEMDNEAGQITNRYIKGEERSFTIIAYPVPEIADTWEDFGEIFGEIVKINTLDSRLYEKIQQKIILALDSSQWVRIKGKGENVTDLKIHLHSLEDIKKQTNFENCVADVNIPVGEVFTSPVLEGTNGVLHVSRVYLNGLLFQNLKLTFTDGLVTDYSCSNFEEEEENRKYIEENILYHHEKLPMGEFAIGTNTTAYVAAAKYQIGDKLPILIAEKMGPHFAVGDTCYSWSEDTAVFNPDGREIIARDNEISVLRKDDLSKAYYGCHTDITIPYEELESIRTMGEQEISIIEDGRFVLEGTEKLNQPFEC